MRYTGVLIACLCLSNWALPIFSGPLKQNDAYVNEYRSYLVSSAATRKNLVEKAGREFKKEFGDLTIPTIYLPAGTGIPGDLKELKTTGKQRITLNDAYELQIIEKTYRLEYVILQAASMLSEKEEIPKVQDVIDSLYGVKTKQENDSSTKFRSVGDYDPHH